jgi:Tfp pilus assembly protein PilP
MDKITIKDMPIELFDKLLLLVSGGNLENDVRDDLREKLMLIRKNFQHRLDALNELKKQQPTEDEYTKSANPTSAEHIK